MLRRMLHIHRWRKVDERTVDTPALMHRGFVTEVRTDTFIRGKDGEIVSRCVLTTYHCRCGKPRTKIRNPLPPFDKRLYYY